MSFRVRMKWRRLVDETPTILAIDALETSFSKSMRISPSLPSSSARNPWGGRVSGLWPAPLPDPPSSVPRSDLYEAIVFQKNGFLCACLQFLKQLFPIMSMRSFLRILHVEAF